MKKIFLAAIMVAALTTSVFAAAGSVNDKASQHLAKAFKNASNIQWTSTGVFTKASFNWNKQALDVFYDTDGEYVGTSRTITIEALPLEALKTINDKYKDSKIIEVIEFNDAQNEMNYYVSIENERAKIALKISPYGEVNVFKRTVK